MKREDIIAILSQIERELPVYDWQFNGIDLWPVCKWMIFTQIFYADKNKENITPVKQISFLKRKLGFLWYLGRGVLKYYKNIYSLKKYDAIFLGATSHRVNFNGQFINRYYEPLKSNYNSCLFIEHSLDLDKNYPHDSIINLKDFKPYFILKNKFSKKENAISLTSFDKLNSYLPSFINIIKLKKELLSRAKLIENYAMLFDKIFNKSRPKVVYSLCYYSLPNHAFHYVANKQKITNYDIQHGGQGALHAMYLYHNIPSQKRINTIPQRFWVWDGKSYQHLNSWLPKNIGYSVENKGNPWWKFAIQNFNSVQELSPEKIILYTLQFESLDEYVLDAISLTSKDYTWFLRTHPRQKESKKIIYKQLKEKNLLSKVEMNMATELPLPVLLKNCTIHISKYSGSIIEASEMEKTSIILESIGIKTYENLIKENKAIPLENPTGNELIKLITNFSL